MPYEKAGLWVCEFLVSPENVKRAVALIRAEVKRIVEKGVTQEELDNAKRYLKGYYVLEFDKNEKIVTLMSGLHQHGLSHDYPQKRDALIDALTLEEVNAAAKVLFSDEAGTVTAVVSPKPDISGFAVQKKDELRF